MAAYLLEYDSEPVTNYGHLVHSCSHVVHDGGMHMQRMVGVLMNWVQGLRLSAEPEELLSAHAWRPTACSNTNTNTDTNTNTNTTVILILILIARQGVAWTRIKSTSTHHSSPTVCSNELDEL